MLFFKKTSNKINLEYMEVQLVDHCNLNCRACSHFSNISEPYFYPVSDYEEDLKFIEQKFSLSIFRILGGEPLLHPNLIEILKTTRKYLPVTPITIVTNGILLLKQSEEFWETLKSTGITVDLSVYPISRNMYDEITALLKKHNIYYSYAKTDYFYLFFNPDMRKNYKKMYLRCKLKRCRILYKRKLYQCPICACSELYEKKFNKKIYIDKGIDFKSESIKSILSKLSKPIKTCQYCDFDSVKIADWAISNSEPYEWYET